MKTIQLTSPNSTQAPGSAVGATQGARRATGVAPSAKVPRSQNEAQSRKLHRSPEHELTL